MPGCSKMLGCCEDRLSVNQVPEEYKELAICSGYRRPGLTFTESLWSIFGLHNETFNVWTHLISTICYVYYIYYVFQSYNILQTEYQALLCLQGACCLLASCSTVAHLFSSMSSVIRHTCFMIDYLGITVYAFAACITNKIYALPRSWQGGAYEKHFLTFMFVNCFLCVFIACHSRFLPKNQKSTKMLRLGAFVLPYIFGMLPCMYRVWDCASDNSCAGAAYYGQHFFITIFTVTFYGGHVPEIFFPGYFDIFFQSHSIFHVTVVTGTFYHMYGNVVDMTSRPFVDLSPIPCSPLIPILLLLVLNTCTVIYFVNKLSAHQQQDTKLLNGNQKKYD